MSRRTGRRRQGDRPGGEGLAPAGGDRELESGELDADDQDEHMFASMHVFDKLHLDA
jgi:hypothetical protein